VGDQYSYYKEPLNSILNEGKPPSQFAWLNIGSQGRKEQLLLTDQDNAWFFLCSCRKV
jgi:signal-transduction protein with cAMP-binding, CBS, and nucleotidyltransferase domain